MKAVKVSFKNNSSNLSTMIIGLNCKHYSEVTSLISHTHRMFAFEFEEVEVESKNITHIIQVDDEGYNEIVSVKYKVKKILK